MPERIRENIGVLVKKLDSSAVIDELLRRYVLSAKEFAEIDEAIAEKGVVNGGNGLLLRRMMTKSPEEIDVFFDCLDLHQTGLARELASKHLGVQSPFF